MEVITIESTAYKYIIQRIENLERMMLSVTKLANNAIEQNGEISSNRYPEYMSREQAAEEFQTSLTTVDKKIKKFKVSRLSAGGKNLLHRQEFIQALRQPDPLAKVINSKQPTVQKNKKVDPQVDP